MKVFGFLVVVLVLVAALFGTSLALADIAGSAHDFSLESWSTNDICGPCHTPHNSVSGGAPLWNHTNTTYSTWTMYDNTNGTQNSTVPAANALGAVSKACLSCHDGTTAVDSFGGATGADMIGAFGSSLTIGAGGILTELLADTITCMIPASEADIRAALAGLKTAALLTGYRGRSHANLEAVVSACMALQAYVAEVDDRLEELDINPLMVTPHRAVAADALIRVRDTP